MKNEFSDIGKLTVPKGGLAELVSPVFSPLHGLNKKLKNSFSAFLDKCYHEEKGMASFRETASPDADEVVETTACAMRIMFQLGDMERFKKVIENRKKIQKRIETRFSREYMIYNGNDSQDKDRFSWRMHDDPWARKMLALMSLKAKPFPSGMEGLSRFPWAFQHKGSLTKWLEKCCSKGFRAGVKEISQYYYLYRKLMNVDLDEHGKKIISFLFSLRDSKTGYIGMDDDAGWAMRGHRNNILIYAFNDIGLREPVNWQEKVMGSTLALQRKDGLFHDGSMCANMDAVQLLAEYHLQSGLLRDETISSIRKSVRGIFKVLRAENGAFYFKMEQIPQRNKKTASPWHVSGTAFALEMIRFWQTVDPGARDNLEKALNETGIKI